MRQRTDIIAAADIRIRFSLKNLLLKEKHFRVFAKRQKEKKMFLNFVKQSLLKMMIKNMTLVVI